MIRDYVPKDESVVLKINADNMPAVGSMDPAKLALFSEISPFLKVVEVDGAVVGFMVGLSEQASSYASPNYRWFRQRHHSFAYIDRIAIIEAGRGQGWGQRFYAQFEQWGAESGRRWLCAEVNTIPNNAPSHRFHLAYGFHEVARLRPYGPDEEVAMYEKPLGSTNAAIFVSDSS